jgi:hypothetical protein
MRSHVIVAVVAFSLGALVAALARREPDREPRPPVSSPIATTAAGIGNLGASTTSAPGSVSIGQTTVASTPRRPAPRTTTCVLGGHVRSAGDDLIPVPRAYVGLFQPALVDDSATSEFGQWRGDAADTAKKRQLLAWTYTDDDGRFLFDELRPGTYVVRADFGPLLAAATAPQTLEPGEVRAALDVVLPAAGGLDGVILAPSGVRFEGWRVGLQRPDTANVGLMSIDGIPEDTIEVRIEEDGTFQVGPAHAGVHRVWLVDRSSGRRQRNAQRVLIGEVTIVESEFVKLELDFRGAFPPPAQATDAPRRLQADPAPR